MHYICLNVKTSIIILGPYDIYDKAINDLLKEYSSNFAANCKKFKTIQKESLTINYNTF